MTNERNTDKSSDSLEGRIALVTGASRGIGRAIAQALAAEGADVAVNFRSHPQHAQEVCEEIRRLERRAFAVQGDVSIAGDVARVIETVSRELGPVGVLVNNAGMAKVQKADEVTEADWDETLAINLKSVFLMTNAVLPAMRAAHWGRIISLSSVAAFVGGFVGPHYAASKAGVLGLTHSYAAVLAKDGITVNAVAPGMTQTDMISGRPEADPANVPLGRLGRPEEIADVVVMLAKNGYMSGQTIVIDGGRYYI